MDVVDLALELFTASYAAAPGDGEAWEVAARQALARHGARFGQIPGGVSLFGFGTASGLPHQLDAVVEVEDAFAVLELKAHCGTVPKNDLLRFVAATDDFIVGLGADLPHRPIYRVLASLGRLSMGMRRFAALHGIAVVERGRWPSIVLASPSIGWPDADGAPSAQDRDRLSRLVRPAQTVMRRVGECYLYEPGVPGRELDGLLALEDEWSDRLWAALQTRIGAPVPAVAAA